MVNEVDADGNGDIDLPEFISLMAKKLKSAENEEELVEAFKIFDRAGDGLIRPKELKEAMAVLGEIATTEEVEMMMLCADPDGNDVISFDEFQHTYNLLTEEQKRD